MLSINYNLISHKFIIYSRKIQWHFPKQYKIGQLSVLFQILLLCDLPLLGTSVAAITQASEFRIT